MDAPRQLKSQMYEQTPPLAVFCSFSYCNFIGVLLVNVEVFVFTMVAPRANIL